jgi:hypothetical protein
MRYEILTVVTTKTAVLWDVTPYSLVDREFIYLWVNTSIPHDGADYPASREPDIFWDKYQHDAKGKVQ